MHDHTDSLDQTVSQVFADSVRSQADRTAIRLVGPDGFDEWTYRQLADKVDRVCGAAFEGVEPGARVAMVLPSGADYVAGFLAALQSGAIAVPVYIPSTRSPERYLARARKVLLDCAPSAVYTSAELVDAVRSDSALAGVPVCTAQGSDPIRDPAPASLLGPDAPAFLQYSSGSTGDPKGIVNTHASILRQVDIISTVWNRPEPIRTVSWLPLYHDMGMFWGILGPLLSGGTATLIRPHDFVRSPRIWLETVSQVRGNWIAGPDFGYRRSIDAFDEKAVATLDLSCLRIATNGAEPVRADTLRTFTGHFAPAGLAPDVMSPQYGLAEAGLCVSGTVRSRPWRATDFDASGLERGRAVPVSSTRADATRTRTLVSCGDSTIGWDVHIVDPDSATILEDGQVGEIWVTGLGMPAGYWRRTAATAATFEARTSDGQGPFLRTGDAGVRCDGELYICGRYRDLLIVAGTNHFPNDIEATAENAGFGLARGSACAVQPGLDTSEWSLVIETDSSAEDLDDLARIITRRILAEHDTTPDHIYWVRPRTLPLTTSGKIRRSEVVRRLADDDIDVVYRSSFRSDAASEEHSDVVRFVAGRLGRRPEQLTADVDLVELGLTSMMTADFVSWAAARGRRLEFADLYASTTIAAWQRLLEQTPQTAPDSGEPASAEEPTAVATTALQQAYWVGRDPQQPLGGVGCQTYFELVGARLDAARMQDAVNAVAARHPMLRSSFPTPDSCVIDPSPQPVELTVHHYADTSVDLDTHLLGVRDRLRNQRFDVAAGQCWTIELTHTPDASILHVAIDLMIADVTSIGIVLRDLAALYRGETLPAPVPPARSLPAQGLPAPAVVGSLPEGPQLPQIPERDIEFRRRHRTLSAHTLAAIDAAAHEAGVTRAAAMLTCYNLVLQRWSSSVEFIVNLTTFGRTPVNDGAVGDFTDVRLHHCALTPGASLLSHARETQQGLRAALQSADSGTALREQVTGGSGHSGLAPVVFTYAGEATLLAGDDVATLGSVDQATSMTPQVLIDNQCCALDDSIMVSWDYRSSCFPPGVVDDMFDAYIDLLERAGSTDWNEQLTVGLPQRCRTIRADRNATGAPLPDGLLFDAFLARVADSPERTAICWSADEYEDDEADRTLYGSQPRLTYRELDRYARGVATAVSEHHSPGAVIGIQLPKGPSQVVAVLGTLMAGCTYLPISVDQPVERVDKIRQRSGMRGLIRHSLSPKATDTSSAIVEQVLADMIVRDPCEPVRVSPEQPAYVIYTSGSTGEPKGVVLSHVAALNTVLDVNARNRITRDDCVLAVSALDFDLSVYDVFGVLSCGGAIVTISDAARRDAFRWRDLIRSFGVTVWNSVPGLMEMLLIAARADDTALSSMRAVFLSGDWIPLDLPERLRQASPNARLVAMGGATEAAIWSNEFVVDEVDPAWASIPYGFPLTNQMYRVVGEHGLDQPDLVPGELWIGGEGVALGYHNAPELTAERFRADTDGTRWYRTGDLGCYWPDGTLQFLGRIDSQVKIRGHRVECGEVEHVLRDHPAVDSAVVVPIAGNTALGCVVCPANGAHPVDEELRVFAAGRLPTYMVPRTFVPATTVPRSANGKVDRRAATQLVERSVTTGPDTDARGLNSVEQVIAQVWHEVLEVPADSFTVEANFFALGGDSLRATEVCSRLGRRGVIGADVETLLGKQTLRDFAAECVLGERSVSPDSIRMTAGSRVSGSRAADSTTSSRTASVSAFPLTRLQQAYVLGAAGMRNVIKSPTAFAIVLENEDRSPIDLDKLAKVVERCTAELDMLRCRLDTDVTQRIRAESGPTAVHIVDGIDDDPDSLLGHLGGVELDLRDAPALQCFAAQQAPASVGLLVNYLTLDARSIATVVSAILADYDDLPRPARIDGTGETFQRFVLDESNDPDPGSRGAASVAGPPELPVAAGAQQAGVGVDSSVRFARRTFTLTGADHEKLRAVARTAQVTPTAVILEAFTDALHSVGAGERFAISIPRTYRPDYAAPELETLGNFTRLFLCESDYSVNRPASSEAIRAVAQQLRGIVGAAADGTAAIAAARSARPGGYPVVFTSTLGVGRPPTGSLRNVRTLTRTPGVHLDCQVEDDDAGIRISWDVAEGALAESAVSQAFAAFERSVRAHLDPSSLAHEVEPGDSFPIAAISGALKCLAQEGSRPVSPEYRELVHRWHAQSPTSGISDRAHRAGRRLADIVTGTTSPHVLLGDVELSPEALLLQEPQVATGIEDLVERVFAHARTVRRTLRIAELGSRTGLITESVHAALRPVVAEYVAVEPNPVRRTIAAERPSASSVRHIDPADLTSSDPFDIVLCFGSLHQLADAGSVVANVPVAQDGWLWLAENHRFTAASLVSAAVLEPAVIDREPDSPDRWWQFLNEHGWTPWQMTAQGPGLTILARSNGPGMPHTECPPFAPATSVSAVSAAADPSFVPEENVPLSGASTSGSAAELLAGLWKLHLGVTPSAEDDFFLLGGDSLAATRIYTQLHEAGYDQVSMVDLFNYPVFGELVEHLGGKRVSASHEGSSPERGLPASGHAVEQFAYPLTPIQQAYAAGRRPGYVLSGVAAHCYFEFTAHDVDVPRFTDTVREVIRRHPGLRTTTDDAIATVHEHPLEPVVREQADVRSAMQDQVIDLTIRPGIDIGIQSLDGNRTLIGISMDNMLLDGASMMTVLAELDHLYRGLPASELPAIPTTFAEYVNSHPTLSGERDEARTPQLASARRYWRERLSSLPPAPRIVPSATVIDIERPVFDRVVAGLDATTWAAARGHCRSEGVTVSALLIASYAEVLSAWSGADHFCINVTMFDRDPAVAGIEHVVGDFTSLILLECRFDRPGSIWERARAIQVQLMADISHRAADAVWLQRELLGHHGSPEAAMFPVVFTSGLGLRDNNSGGVFSFGEQVFGASQTPQTVLDFQVWEDSGQLRLSWDFVTEAIPAQTARHHLDRLVENLTSSAASKSEAPSQTQASASGTDLPERIAQICALALGRSAVNPNENFFQLGGDSVTATAVVEQVSREISAAATLRMMFAHPVIADFAAAIQRAVADAAETETSDDDVEEGML
ncbi:amino acid adenylation domain-containing protein [Rhodococcus sp. NPDC058521]|uniref:amino acid adenylation domain-containing protein n=1 Tax=Rhodococcus sp. NPDC058521 TaxID=3346536 RepID=UPI0036519321